MPNIIEEVKKKGGVILETPRETDAVFNVHFDIGAPAETKDWSTYLPTEENQKSTAFCVTFSRLNAYETAARRDGLNMNLSDRYLGVMAGTTQTGNSLNKVSDQFRKGGTVKEELCKWKDEWLVDPRKYWKDINDLSAVPASAERKKGGNHSWVYGKQAMRAALAYGPLQIAVGVGANWGQGIVTDPGEDNYGSYHAVMLYWIDGVGNYYIYDSVSNPTKILDKDYKILQCKSFADLPDGWKDELASVFASIRAVFGPTWEPPRIFYKRGLIDKGIYGAVRVGGSRAIPPYRVYLLGPGGRPVASQDDFRQLFGTIYQDGIVGMVTPDQARALGITDDQFESAAPIALKSSPWVSFWRGIVY